jgi:hypothetical protein
MKKEKLSQKSIKNVLSRAELKKIMAGSGGGCTENAYCGAGHAFVCCPDQTCQDFNGYFQCASIY